MEKTALPYAEMLRRKAQKKRALAAGEAEQERLRASFEKQERPALPKAGLSHAGASAISSVKMVKRAPSGAPHASSAAAHPASPSRAESHPVAHPQVKPPASSAAGGRPHPSTAPAGHVALKARKPAPQQASHSPRTAPPLQGSEDRLLLETQELDLFHKKTKSRLLVCPECHHELVKLMCCGKMVPVCCHCRGIWLNRSTVGEFAEEIDWFQQLSPAVDLYVHSKGKE